MGQRKSKSGKKYSGSHTTVIPAALPLIEAAERLSIVYKIAPGFIKAGLRPGRGLRRAKFTVLKGHIKLAVRDNIAQQELFIYTTDTESTLESLIKQAEKYHMNTAVHRE